MSPASPAASNAARAAFSASFPSEIHDIGTRLSSIPVHANSSVYDRDGYGKIINAFSGISDGLAAEARSNCRDVIENRMLISGRPTNGRGFRDIYDTGRTEG